MALQHSWVRAAIQGFEGRMAAFVQQRAQFLPSLSREDSFLVDCADSFDVPGLPHPSTSAARPPSGHQSPYYPASIPTDHHSGRAQSSILCSTVASSDCCSSPGLGGGTYGSDQSGRSRKQWGVKVGFLHDGHVKRGFAGEALMGCAWTRTTGRCFATRSAPRSKHRNPAAKAKDSVTGSPSQATETTSQVTQTTSKSKSSHSDSEAELLAATAPSKTKSDGTIGARFYKTVGVEQEDSDFRVTLDGRRLRSPAQKPLVLPTKELALAIAAEWEWQDQTSIRPFTMPLMKLASTATDLVPRQRPAIIENLMKYFRASDAVCVREPREGALKRKQEQTWDPILDWFEKEMGVRPVTSASIFGAEQPQAVVRRVQEVLEQKSDFRLAAVDALASSAHSLVIALAVSRGHLGLQKALESVRLEEDFQIEEWGLVEGGHDLDIADTRVRIAAPSLFLRLLNE